ncbi:MAG: tetratricopeptide repeat protein, partial [Pseudomonadota bacterium]
DGKREEAILVLETLVADAEPSDNRRRVQVLLARFLTSTGNEVGARAIVEDVLTQDPSMVQALEMRASWLIEEDRADEAISALRQALDQEPEDVSAMTLMAQAHARNGNRALAGELLALAATTSNFAPDEALRYASFLSADEKFIQAEEMLLNALRAAPRNTDVLTQLGQVYVNLQDWGRAEQVATSLRRSTDPAVVAAADTLQLRILNGRQGAEQAMQFLEELAQADDGSAISANVALIRARAAQGEFESASRLVSQLIAENPEILALAVLDAAVDAAAGDIPSAEQKYAAILERQPLAQDVWLQLLRLQTRTGRIPEAEATLEKALAAIPGAPNLLWAKASLLEREGNRVGALEVYEELYERNTSSPIVANNLASLMTQLDQSAETVDRAYSVARRLRGSDVPAFQDTYGWISYLRGDYEEALSHLEGAAAGLANDPVVQMHLGLTLVALDRPEEARAQLEKAVDLAGAERADLVTKATEALAALDSAPETTD